MDRVRVGCSIYFAGGDPITVTDSKEDVLKQMRERDVFSVQVATGYGYSTGSIVSKHVVAVVSNQ